MIEFYIERQPNELLTANFFDDDGEFIGHRADIPDKNIDSAVSDMFPFEEKKQIFEKPNEL